MTPRPIFCYVLRKKHRRSPAILCENCFDVLPKDSRAKYFVLETRDSGAKCEKCGALAGQLDFTQAERTPEERYWNHTQLALF